MSLFKNEICIFEKFPQQLSSKESACDTGDPASFPGSRRSPGEGNVNTPQYSCLENSMGRGTWWATFHGIAKSQTQLSSHTVYEQKS